LQILTNAQFVEGKTHQAKEGAAAELEDQPQRKGEDESSEGELDIEDKKLLIKRKKRQIKVEDCNIDLDSFIT
jgi:hypothetical protein